MWVVHACAGGAERKEIGDGKVAWWDLRLGGGNAGEDAEREKEGRRKGREREARDSSRDSSREPYAHTPREFPPPKSRKLRSDGLKGRLVLIVYGYRRVRRPPDLVRGGEVVELGGRLSDFEEEYQ